MNDEFLTKYHKTPRAAFADELYERISQQPQPRFPEIVAQKLTFRNAVVAFIFMVLVAACVYAVVEKRWDKVGDIWVDVQKTHKVEFFPIPETSEEPDTQPQSYECLTVEEARKILRFDFQVPAWAPEGFAFDDKICGVDRFSDFASLNWEGADKYTGIHIMLSNRRGFNMSTQEYEIWPASTMFPVAPGSYEEVQVHGRPAVLVRGNWESPWMTENTTIEGEMEVKWDKKRGFQLYWVDGEVLYYLYTLADISPEDLIKMAESAQ
jgi:hypothetical protein